MTKENLSNPLAQRVKFKSLKICSAAIALACITTGLFITDIAIAQTVSAIVVKANKPIADAQGRTRYIVDFVEDNAGRPDKFSDTAGRIAWQKARSALLTADVAKTHSLELLGTTSLVGTSFVAYLSAAQVELLAKDKRVALLTEDTYIQPSSLWNNSTDSTGQVRPWGIQAMNTGGGRSSGAVTVYILDAGVEPHPDLTGLTERLSALPGIDPTGCYPHATHVAGIVGADDNGFGVVGMNPGAKLVSIALGDTNLSVCTDGRSGSGSTNYSYSGITQALELVYQRVFLEHKVAIINLSFNSPGVFAATGTIGQKMRAVATPVQYDTYYPGVFIVQSAGNDTANACDYSYNAPSSSDGIMVVSGIDANGQPVVPLAGLAGFVNLPYGRERPTYGANTGACVEAWAPSQQIRSTWTNSSYAPLSGTSMAAPHVAGMAARLLEYDSSINSSVVLEQHVRAYFANISGPNLSIPRLFLGGQITAIPTIEIVDGTFNELSESTIIPRYSTGMINFYKFPEEIQLRYDSKGASSCVLEVTQNTNYFTNGNLGVTSAIAGYYLPPGQDTWKVTCTSAQGSQNSASVSSRVKRHVVPSWYANTTSTNGNLQNITNGTVVTWSAATNASFSQQYISTGADYCQVDSYGHMGNAYADFSNPQYSPVASPPYSLGALLWTSGNSYPPAYNFGTFYFGDPSTAAPPLGPYYGYKWVLTCTNSDGDSKQTVMYGTKVR